MTLNLNAIIYKLKKIYAPVCRAAFFALFALSLAVSCACAAPQQSKYFGFYEVEFYKGSNMAHSLKHGDINGDGVSDITFLDAEKSQIAMLINSAAGAGKDESGEAELNTISYDDRFTRFNVALERKVYDYEFVKLKGDTLESLVLIAEPRWLIVYRQDANMQFHEYSKVQLDESNYSKAQAAGYDVDGDGLRDIVIMCPDFFISALNCDASEFGRNARYIPFGSEYGAEPSQFLLFDADSDGFNDIIYSYSAKTANLRVKFGSQSGAFLDEESYDLLSFRAMDFLRLASRGAKTTDKAPEKTVMSCVLENSNLLYAYELNNKPAQAKDSNIKLSSVYFNKDDKSQKFIYSIYDFNSDGAVDAAVINPEQGRLGIYFYSSDNKIKSYEFFPFMAQIVGAFAVRSEKPGVTNVIAYSKDRILKAELNSAGMKYEFCKPAENCAGAFFAAPFKTASGSEKIALLAKESGEVFLKTADSDLRTVGSGGRIDFNLDNATGLKINCAGSDIVSFMAYFKYDPAKLFIKNKDGVYVQAAFNDKTQAAAMNFNNTALCDFDGDGTAEILFGDKNTVKIYDIDYSNFRMVQKDQINAGPADFDCECIYAAGGVIYAYDPESKRIFEYGTGARGRKITSVEKKFNGAAIFELNGRPAFINNSGISAAVEKPALAFDKFNLGDYEEIKNGRYNNLLAKDINGDGVSDLILTCGAQNYLDIFNFIDNAWKLSLRFKIFNTKQFNQYSSYTSEPQMIDSADFDGDGYNDLAMLVHNKVLVYYSDSPAKPGARADKKKGGK